MAPAGDLTPVLQLVDKVGQAVNGLGGAQAEQLKQIQTALVELKQLMLVQLTALHHIYMSTPNLAQLIQGKDVGDAQKFIGFITPFVPR